MWITFFGFEKIKLQFHDMYVLSLAASRKRVVTTVSGMPATANASSPPSVSRTARSSGTSLYELSAPAPPPAAAWRGRPRPTGLRAIQLAPEDELVEVAITSGQAEIVLVSSNGKAIRFPESNVREVGRTARGVRGMSLRTNQRGVSMIVVEADDANKDILLASAMGNGKRTRTQDFPVRRRGGVGVIAIKDGARNGETIGARQVEEGDQVALITDSGRLVRTGVSEISQLGRNTQGVRLIALSESEALAGIERIDESMHLVVDDVDGLELDSKVNGDPV